MKTPEIFKGRFGNFYLYKIWAFTVVVGATLYPLIDSIQYPISLDSSFFGLILLMIIYGMVLCIPSLIISETFYKILSKSEILNQMIFILILIISLITTNLTYYLFWSALGNVDSNFYIFSISYNICLITGFFIFKQKPETLNFKL
ncbi:MAG: hypothetical protein QM564_03000 [Bergeyella sp.]